MTLTKIALLITFSALVVTPLAACAAPDDGWLGRVPSGDQAQKIPVRKRAGAIRTGQQTFRNHCAQCHGGSGECSNRAPALVSFRVQHRATDGDLHWLLVNGNRERGMPSWSKLGDLQIWQVISYVRTLR